VGTFWSDVACCAAGDPSAWLEAIPMPPISPELLGEMHAKPLVTRTKVARSTLVKRAARRVKPGIM
jgi:hypothetical protein